MEQISSERYLIFDFDGTIADTYLMGIEIFNELAPKYGLHPIRYEELDELRSMNLKQIIKRTGVPIWKLPTAGMIIRRELYKRISEVPIFPGIKEVILELKNGGFQLSLLTSNSRDNVEKFLKLNDLEVFDQILTGAGLWSKHKSISKMIKLLGIDKSQAIYIGDETRDIKASRRSGVKVVAVSWGFNTRSYLEKEKPDMLVTEVSELLNVANL